MAEQSIGHRSQRTTHISADSTAPNPLLIGTTVLGYLLHIVGSRPPHVSEHLAVRILPDKSGPSLPPVERSRAGHLVVCWRLQAVESGSLLAAERDG
jgi:hypothetical protein